MIEHQIITTSRKILREGEVIPVGSTGTVVHVFKDKDASVVEFNDLPDNPVVTVYSSEIVKE
jgi:hypothetical protein